MQTELRCLRVELERAIAGLDQCQMQLRPAGLLESWTIQQIVEHLRLTYAATLAAMDARIAKGTPTKAKVSLQLRAAQWMVLRFGYFPRGRKAPAAVTAEVGMLPVSGAEMMMRLDAELTQVESSMAQVEALFGAEARAVNHRLLGPMCSRDWQRFHLTHGRHHLKQVAAIRRKYGI